jgi:hypothetical protein
MNPAAIRWLRQSRTLLIDGYWPPFNPVFEFNAETLIQTALDLRANTIRFATAAKASFIQNPIFPVLPEIGNRDLLAETLRLSQPAGIKVIAYVPVAHGLPRSFVAGQKPEWALRRDDGSLSHGVVHFGGEDLVALCPFGPYQRDILAFITFVVQNYAVDGLYLDGPYHNWNMSRKDEICQCESCKTLFEQSTGAQLPTNRELESWGPDSKRKAQFENWVGEGLLALLRKIKAIAREPKELPLMFNAYAAGCRPAEYEVAMLKEADGFLLEAELGGLKGLAIGSYYNKQIWRYTQPHLPWPRGIYERQERANALCGYETLLWGGTPIVSYGGRFCLEKRHRDPVRDLFTFIENNEATLSDTVPVPYAAIVSFQRVTAQDPSLQKALAGMYLALQASGLQTSVIPRAAILDMRALAPYAVVILPQLGGLDAAECTALADFVTAGGRLLVTGTTSLMDTHNPVMDTHISLGKLLGIEWAGADVDVLATQRQYRWWEGNWDIYCQPDPLLGLDVRLPCKDLIPIRATHGSRVLGHFVAGSSLRGFAPAIVENCTGKGKTVYVATSFESLYRDHPEIELRQLIAGLVLCCTDRTPPYAFVSSAKVIANLFEKKGMRLLHILDTDLDRSSTRVTQLTLTIPNHAQILDVRECVTNQSIAFEKTPTGVCIPQLECVRYRCVCVAYQ